MSEQKVDYYPPSKPWAEREGRLHLIGMKCSYCETLAFPAREICSSCGQPDGLGAHELSNTGTLYTFSEVHVGPNGFATPYVVGYVDLEDGVRVLAQIDGTVETLTVGQKVRSFLGQIRARPDGTRVLSYRFQGAPK